MGEYGKYDECIWDKYSLLQTNIKYFLKVIFYFARIGGLLLIFTIFCLNNINHKFINNKF